MHANALQYDLFGQHMPLFLRAIPKKSSIEDVCNIISNKVTVEEVAAQAATTMPKSVFGIDVGHPTNIFERMLAERIKASYASVIVQAMAEEEDHEEENLDASADDEAEEEEGGGIIGAHKKLLKLSLKDLKAGRDTHEISMWIMDGRDQNRLFSFEACCAMSEIDADSLRDNLLNNGFIAQRFLH